MVVKRIYILRLVVVLIFSGIFLISCGDLNLSGFIGFEPVLKVDHFRIELVSGKSVNENEPFEITVTAVNEFDVKIDNFSEVVEIRSNWGDLRKGDFSEHSNSVGVIPIGEKVKIKIVEGEGTESVMLNRPGKAILEAVSGNVKGKSDGIVVKFQDWTDFQLVLDIGIEGTYDVEASYMPNVIKFDNQYRMWYSGRDAGSLQRTLHCDSANGKSWSNHELVIDLGSEGTYDTLYASKPSVIKEDDTYRMWYQGRSGPSYRIIHCDSADGINWDNFQLVIDLNSEGTYDTNHAAYPSVIKDGDTYKMWYTGYAISSNRIIYCESTDGIIWTDFKMVIEIDSLGTYDVRDTSQSEVFKDGNVYKMYYSGGDAGDIARIIYCDSTDGKNWDNFRLAVDMNSVGAYDTAGASSAVVIKDGSVFKMWYTGRDGSDKFRTIFCAQVD